MRFSKSAIKPMQGKRSNCIQRTRSNCIQRTRNNFIQRTRNNWIQRTRNNCIQSVTNVKFRPLVNWTQFVTDWTIIPCPVDTVRSVCVESHLTSRGICRSRTPLLAAPRASGPTGPAASAPSLPRPHPPQSGTSRRTTHGQTPAQPGRFP